MKQEHHPRLACLVVAVAWIVSSSQTLAAANDGSGAGIFGRQFDAADAPRASAAILNEVTTGEQRRSSVAVFPDGDFVAVWDTPEANEAGLGIVGRFFASDGTPLNGDFRVNTYTTGNQRRHRH